MDIVFVLLPLTLFLALIGGAGYLWAARSKQFEDLETPRHRILFDEDSDEERDRQ